MIQRLLRWAAVAIALAALFDPSLALTARQRPRLAITLERPGDAASAGVLDRLTHDLRSSFDVVPGPDRDAPAAVVIGHRYPDRPSRFSPRTSTVTLAADSGGTGARIASVRAPKAVPRGTRIEIEVILDAVAATASTSVVTVSAGAVGHP